MAKEFTYANVRRAVIGIKQLEAVCNQVGSYYPRRENFRLTPEVKEKFTEELRQDPREFCGHPVDQAVRTDGLKLVFSDRSRVC